MAMTAYKEAMNSGKLYKVMEFAERDPHYREYLQQIEEYNRLGYSPEAETAKQIILRSLFAEVGDGAYIQAPYHAMWGGHHVHLGRNVWIASNVAVLPGRISGTMRSSARAPSSRRTFRRTSSPWEARRRSFGR